MNTRLPVSLLFLCIPFAAASANAADDAVISLSPRPSPPCCDERARVAPPITECAAIGSPSADSARLRLPFNSSDWTPASPGLRLSGGDAGTRTEALKITYSFAGSNSETLAFKGSSTPGFEHIEKIKIRLRGSGTDDRLRIFLRDSTGERFTSEQPVRVLPTDWVTETVSFGHKLLHHGGDGDGIIDPPVRMDSIVLARGTARQGGELSFEWLEVVGKKLGAAGKAGPTRADTNTDIRLTLALQGPAATRPLNTGVTRHVQIRLANPNAATWRGRLSIALHRSFGNSDSRLSSIEVPAHGTIEKRVAVTLPEPGHYIFRAETSASGGHVSDCVSTSLLAWEPAGNAEKDSSPHFFGAMASLDRFMANLDDDLELMRMAGVRVVRFPFRWSEIEPARGKYQWSGYDRIFAAIAKYGMVPQPMAFQTPPWAQSKHSGIGLSRHKASFLPPQDPRAFGTFLHAAARRYGKYGPYWEVWNEPHAPQYWLGGSVSQYLELLRAARHAIKETDSQQQIISGGLGALTGSARTFAQGLFGHAADSFDIFAIHSHGRVEHLQAVLQSLRAEKAFPALSKPVWLNETGTSVDPDEPNAELIRAAETAKKIVVARHHRIGNFGWFIFRNSPEASQSNTDNFAILDPNGSPRPVLLAYNTAARLLVDAEPLTMPASNANRTLYGFRSGDRTIWVTWSTDPDADTSTRIPVPDGARAVVLNDMFGGRRRVKQTNNNDVLIPASEYPVYITIDP